MKSYFMSSFLLKLSIVLFVLLSMSASLTSPVYAGPFSGSEIGNYFCAGHEEIRPQAITTEGGTNYVCIIDGVRVNAVPRPPTIQVIEIWFVRVLYAVWGITGVVFIFIIMWIGLNYMFALGNAVAQADAIKRFQRWALGLVLIFLSYPGLNTFFNILPISDDYCYEELVEATPGFRFFFAEICDTGADGSRPTGSGEIE